MNRLLFKGASLFLEGCKQAALGVKHAGFWCIAPEVRFTKFLFQIILDFESSLKLEFCGKMYKFLSHFLWSVK